MSKLIYVIPFSKGLKWVKSVDTIFHFISVNVTLRFRRLKTVPESTEARQIFACIAFYTSPERLSFLLENQLILTKKAGNTQRWIYFQV